MKFLLNRFRFGALAALLLMTGFALAQTVPGAIKITSLSGSFSIPIDTTGPQAAKLPLNGATFTCTAGGDITVANTAVDAGSLIIMTPKTVGGTVAAPFVKTITAATGFVATCGASDTTVYNYLIIG
jgi:hypothetical protein